MFAAEVRERIDQVPPHAPVSVDCCYCRERKPTFLVQHPQLNGAPDTHSRRTKTRAVAQGPSSVTRENAGKYRAGAHLAFSWFSSLETRAMLAF